MSFYHQQSQETAAATATYSYVREQVLAELGTLLDDQGISRETDSLEDNLYLVMYVTGRLQADLNDPSNHEHANNLAAHVKRMVSFQAHLADEEVLDEDEIVNAIFSALTDQTMPHLQDALMTGFEHGLTYSEYVSQQWHYPAPIN